MVDLTLTEFQQNQSRRISRDIIAQSEAQEQLRQKDAQACWEKAHACLVSILRLMDQDFDEACEKSNRPLESFSDEDITYLIQIRLREVQSVSSGDTKENELVELQKRFNEINLKYALLEQQVSDDLEKIKKLEEEKVALEAHLSALHQVNKSELSQENQEILKDNKTLSPETVPDWFTAWQTMRNFKKTSAVICVMGDLGIALRPSIIKQVAERLSLSSNNKNLDEALNWLLAKEDKPCPALIELVREIPEQGSSSGGNHPGVLRLTAEGKVAYQILTGRLPEENEFDKLIKQHSSTEHTILNIQAGELLKEEGYQIRGRAETINLTNGETYIPDIVAVDSRTGEILFIEVERDTNKDRFVRKQKWIKFFEASNGNLYVFCDNLSCQRAIQAEINQALNGLNYNSFLTNLHGLRNGKRSSKDSSIWLSQYIRK